MVARRWMIYCLCVMAAISLMNCKGNNRNSSRAGSANAPAAIEPDRGTTGVEKVKPAPGTGNVQGKVLFNGKPVENIEVKLCETFNRFLGGCGGKTYTARTDKDGDYVITNVPPQVYEGLLARVFDTDSYIFAVTGVGISANKYEVSADKTLFASPTNLYKGDLKVLNPRAGAKVSAEKLELKWEAYPDAAYYKFSIFPEDASTTSPYVNQRVEATSFSIDKPLGKGTYRWQVEAYNSSDKKLSESSSDINFIIN